MTVCTCDKMTIDEAKSWGLTATAAGRLRPVAAMRAQAKWNDEECTRMGARPFAIRFYDDLEISVQWWSQMLGWSPAKVSGIFAVLSPRKLWSVNKAQAIQALRERSADNVPTIKSQCVKVNRIIALPDDASMAEVLAIVSVTGKGFKTMAFCRHGAGVKDLSVCSDRHNWTAVTFCPVCECEPDISVQELTGVYALVEAIVQDLAASNGILPMTQQAIIWHPARLSKPDGMRDEVRRLADVRVQDVAFAMVSIAA
jgi:hypothetical protein